MRSRENAVTIQAYLRKEVAFFDGLNSKVTQTKEERGSMSFWIVK